MCNQLHTCIETWGIHTHHTYVIYKNINKGKTPSKGTREEKERTKVQTKDHTKKQKTHNGEPKEEKSRNLGPKLITNSTKQVVQGGGQKTWKDTKPRRGLSYNYNYLLQDSGRLNFLKSH
jgi:hypothetical protein